MLLTVAFVEDLDGLTFEETLTVADISLNTLDVVFGRDKLSRANDTRGPYIP